MMRAVLIILLGLSGCELGDGKQIDKDKLTFKTGDDTELFFKNVRQSYYDLEENKAAKFNVFRYSDRSNAQDQPVLNLAIVINYLQDEAYLLLEPNSFLKELNVIRVKVLGADSTTIEIISMQEFNKDQMLEFAVSIYENLLKGNSFEVEVKGKFIPLLQTEQDREAFRITMSDFFRLTRVY